ncbi:hypothetical protein SAMN04488115_107178 [Bosea lathyri]|uniref:Uncharacterized protein n=2 Tax=Bosea lathyri TaxID=1036778 RepID=A0A1H6BFP1_9HYPH|nr:hypothetical protein SAMN04488115_107178 [Bosea lathyri]
MGLIGKAVGGTALLFGGLFAAGLAVTPDRRAETHQTEKPVPERQPTVIPESWRLADHLSVEVQGKSSRLSSVAVLTFRIQNRSDIHLKDATITCDFFGESGTKLGEAQRIAYREFLAKKTVTVRDMNFGFVHQEAGRVGCKATSAERASPV